MVRTQQEMFLKTGAATISVKAYVLSCQQSLPPLPVSASWVVGFDKIQFAEKYLVGVLMLRWQMHPASAEELT